MNEPTVNNMGLRLDRLERENHRLKRISALVVVGIAAVVLKWQREGYCQTILTRIGQNSYSV